MLTIKLLGFPHFELDGVDLIKSPQQIKTRYIALLFLSYLVKTRFQSEQAPKTVDYVFRNSDMWARFLQQVGHLSMRSGTHEHLKHDWVLDELRLNSKNYHHYMRLTLMQMAAERILTSDYVQVDSSEERLERSYRFLAQRGITPDQLAGWLQDNDMTTDDLVGLVDNYHQLDRLTNLWKREINEQLLGTLKLSGMYARYAQRALDKQGALRAEHLDMPDIADVDLTTERLFEWFFVEQQQLDAIPDDIHRFAVMSGFNDVEDFKRALIRDYCFQLLQKPSES